MRLVTRAPQAPHADALKRPEEIDRTSVAEEQVAFFSMIMRLHIPRLLLGRH